MAAVQGYLELPMHVSRQTGAFSLTALLLPPPQSSAQERRYAAAEQCDCEHGGVAAFCSCSCVFLLLQLLLQIHINVIVHSVDNGRLHVGCRTATDLDGLQLLFDLVCSPFCFLQGCWLTLYLGAVSACCRH